MPHDVIMPALGMTQVTGPIPASLKARRLARERGLQVCEKLDSGMIGLNRGSVSDPAAPFGGTKQSGLGREGGHEGMLEFMETQYISASW